MLFYSPFHLHNHRAALQCPHGMPLADGNIQLYGSSPRRTLSGSECTSSQKLMPQMSTRPIINGIYSCTVPQFPSTICHTIHTRMEMEKIMPPPRSTMVE